MTACRTSTSASSLPCRGRDLEDRLLGQRRARSGLRVRSRPRGVLSPSSRAVGRHRSTPARRRQARGRPRRLGDERLQRLVHPRRGRSARRSARHHALDVRARHGRDVPGDRHRPRRAVRAGRQDHHERGNGRRDRRLPAPAPAGGGRRAHQPHRPPDGRAAPARRRPGAVHRPSNPGGPDRLARRRRRLGGSRTSATTSASTSSRPGR